MTKIAYCIDSLWNAAGMERILTLKANQFCSIYNITFIIRDQNGKKPYYTLSNQIKLIDMKAKTPLEYKRGLTILLQKELFEVGSSISSIRSMTQVKRFLNSISHFIFPKYGLIQLTGDFLQR